MSASPNLLLPYIDANQNQKSVTHNEALRMLDALVGLAVQSSALSSPPPAPAEGARWIVASGGAGAWAGRDGQVAAWQDGAWSFFPPAPGRLAFDLGQMLPLVWTGAAWASLFGLIARLGVAALGVGTAPDSGNPLSATLNSALFNALASASGGTGDVRLKLNKPSAANTASFLFQDNFAGRAEIGLAGDDDFHFKVSPDGTAFRDGLVIRSATGAVALSAALGLAAVKAAALPAAGVPGALVFVGDGRKAGEAAGAGTGVVAAFSAGAWRRLSDDGTVSA